MCYLFLLKIVALKCRVQENSLPEVAGNSAHQQWQNSFLVWHVAGKLNE